MTNLTPFLQGAIALTCLAIGIKFLKYWRVSRDRFFVWFTIAFWSMAAGAALRAFVPTHGETEYLVYLPRLLAFLLIIVAIVDKNRRSD